MYPDSLAITPDEQVPPALRTYIPTNRKQPISDAGTKCTIMFPYVATGWGNWAKIACHYKIRGAKYICKTRPFGFVSNVSHHQNNYNTPKRFQDRNNHSSNLSVVNHTCPRTWSSFHTKCLKLESSVSKVNIYENYINLTSLCSDKNSRLALIEKTFIPKLISMIKVNWKHNFSEYGSLLFQSIHEGKIWCYLVVGFGSRIFNFQEPSCVNFTGRNALCEVPMSPVLDSCPVNHFRCSNGKCISDVYVCNGEQNCVNGEDENDCSCSDKSFRCSNNKCIDISLFCDHVIDCEDGSDESNCVYPPCLSDQFRCVNGQCINVTKRCDHIVDCFDKTDEYECEKETVCKGFRCYNGKCIPGERKWDGRSDCDSLFAEDETGIHMSDIKRGTYYEKETVFGAKIPAVKHTSRYDSYCRRTDSVKCTFSNPHCFKRHLACIYVENEYGDQPCRNLEHLSNCEHFICPNHFKCPNSYCIPHRKVCDGLWDCYDGYDEMNCENYTCSGLVKCAIENVCIDKQDVCDGVVDCKNSRDDERFCGVVCPPACDCSVFHANCNGRNLTNIPQLYYKTRSVDLALNSFKAINMELSSLFVLYRLNLSSCGIEVLTTNSFEDLVNLVILDLSWNHLISLHSNMFKSLGRLTNLILNGNSIINIDEYSFIGLQSITSLDLSGLRLSKIKDDTFIGLVNVEVLNIRRNKIVSIFDGAFNGLKKLQRLYLEDNQIDKIEVGTFINLNLNRLLTDKVRFCCLALHVSDCSPKPDEFSSCDDLMSNNFLRISIWGLGIFASVGNMFVLTWRSLKEKVSVPSILVLNLAVSDFLMGVYLLIIGSYDMMYRGEYILHADKWKTSISCMFAGFLSTVSSEMSVFLLIAITLDRVKAIVFPFSQVRLNRKRCSAVVMCGWVVCIVIAVIPLFVTSYFGDNFYGQNAVCLPFTLRDARGVGWQYSLAIFVVVNLTSFLLIFIGYCSIYRSVIVTHKEAGNGISDGDIRLARNITLIVLTDFFCWVPIIMLSVVAITGTRIPAEVSAWVAVIILPLNSALNPILYTIASIDCSRKKKPAKAYVTSSTNSSKLT